MYRTKAQRSEARPEMFARIADGITSAVNRIWRLPLNHAGLDLELAMARVSDELFLDRGTGLRVVVLGHPRTLKRLVREAVCEIGRTAVLDAFRHSNATEVEVETHYSAHRFRILIRDNGSGIDSLIVQPGENEHHRLVQMRERAESAGARLRVWSAPGAGTEIEVNVPGDVAFESQPVVPLAVAFRASSNP